ncbi:YoaK family protein [Aspergillus clavatus NRRL 1]|uniref:DUF1275 domain protein n=1 Tax=Aspergillus clavatus (strain ATCC 1007 / CBS 513.65 / DSM 816 / NCTC 3887 / NRRL 1 / QM 1276 / 107) TaxID=344612 RepID=A1C8V3_ASPCL|nr:DUF1275 domain protein [Aspergillus clavatus NRRL 1]EAW13740.1 DUF1275 domain protein [Aspergillus clavatus NRRL 1]
MTSENNPSRPVFQETDWLFGAGNNRPPVKSRLQQISAYLSTDINPRYGDLLLLFCYIITGLLDSSAVFIWGSFVSMQTGNTVYLGLGLIGLDEGTRWIKAGVSIFSFCLGSYCFALYHRWVISRQRWVLCASFTIQMLCVAAAATIVTVHRPSRDSALSWKVILPQALVAFQSSGQAVTSRVLKLNGLTSVVLTSVYCDFFSNPAFPSLGGVEQRRRAGAVICLVLGTILGGLWAKSEIGLMGALWMAVLFKGLIAVAWLGWKGEHADDL